MKNTELAVQTLKRTIKEHGFIYADVAKHLKMSEASIKKMFSTCHFTLQRIEQICDMVDMDFIDLLRLFDEQRLRISRLTEEQERGLVKNRYLLVVAMCARNHLPFHEILESFQLSKSELYHYLNQLEALQLLELHPNNRIKWLVASNFQWIPRGPIECFVEKYMLDHFLNSGFHQPKEVRIYRDAMLTETAVNTLHQNIYKLEKLFAELRAESAHSPSYEKKSTALFIASRGWEAPFISKLRRV